MRPIQVLTGRTSGTFFFGFPPRHGLLVKRVGFFFPAVVVLLAFDLVRVTASACLGVNSRLKRLSQEFAFISGPQKENAARYIALQTPRPRHCLPLAIGREPSPFRRAGCFGMTTSFFPTHTS